jgi:multidrug efflux pump subunit AcrA (membrane-fusion protein)
MYSQVSFSSAPRRASLVVPGDAVTLSRSGPRVAVVAPDKVVRYRNIAIANDLGSEVEVSSGLAAGELVISNPTDAVHENVVVDVRQK